MYPHLPDSRLTRTNIIQSSNKGGMAHVSHAELRLVLLGKTGNGKRSIPNSVLGPSAYESRVTSPIGQRYRTATGHFCGRRISILDTADPWDPQQTPMKVQEEVRRCVRLLTPGPHAFLLVLEVGKCILEESAVARQIQQALGPTALEYMMVVFTHGDCLDERHSVWDLLVEESSSLGKMVASCGGRFCIFNYHYAKNQEQVVELLALVDQIVMANGEKYFTSKMLQEADGEEERLARNLEGRLKMQPTTAVREWHHHEKMQLTHFRSTEELSPTGEKQRERERLTREREEKGRRIVAMIGVMVARKKEKVMRETLREEQREREERVRRDIEALVQREREELARREKESRLWQVQREQAVRRCEAERRETLQKAVDRLTRDMGEQTKRKEELARERGELIRLERERQREREKEKENLRVEKKEKEALERQLWVSTMRKEGQKEREEEAKRQINECPQEEEEEEEEEEEANKRGEGWIHRLSQCNRESVDLCHEASWRSSSSAQEGSALTSPITGYIQEMGVVLLNVGLQGIGRPCSIQ